MGTNMELWLPQSATAPVTTDTSLKEPPVAPLNGRALLVDDEELVRLTTADMLTDLGYEVVEASSAEQALRLLHDGLRVDLLVTDHLMPGMTGVDLVREIRRQFADLPALLVSGFAEVEGVDATLPRLIKPFRKDELASIIERTARS